MKLLLGITAATLLNACASTPSAAPQKQSLQQPAYKDIPRLEGMGDNPEDRDAQPLVRVAPTFPVQIDKSGHCNLKFDVTAEGRPTLVSVVDCTSNVFAQPSINNVRRWIYEPRLINGEKVRRYGVQTKITFRLMDERGNIIPE